MIGTPGSEPDGDMGDAFWILAYNGEMTTAQVHAHHVDLITSLGDPDYRPLAARQIRAALRGLAGRKPPLAVSDMPGRGAKASWRLTRHGQRMARVWDGESDREPCGLGWPPMPAHCPHGTTPIHRLSIET